MQQRPPNRNWKLDPSLRTATPATETRQLWPGPRLTREGVHECGQRPVQHLEEGVSAGVPLRAAQDRVLQDVGGAAAVGGGGAELHTGDIAARSEPLRVQASRVPA